MITVKCYLCGQRVNLKGLSTHMNEDLAGVAKEDLEKEFQQTCIAIAQTCKTWMIL